MNDETKPQNFATAIKGALAKKHAAHHPDAKKAGSKATKPGAGNAPKGPPLRKAASRGG